jgi:methyl-accepting chemotaxis protein
VAVLPWALAGAPLVAGFALALWLDRGIVGPLRAMNAALGTPDAGPRRALAALRPWGELGELFDWVHALLARLERAGGEAQELRAVRQRLEDALDGLTRSLERWAAGETPEAGGPAEPVPLTRVLERRSEREGAERARLRDRLRNVGSELEADLGAAREAVEHAERGFVEATALLSGLRELERLGTELATVAVAEAGDEAAARESLEGYRAAAAAAIEELVAASAASVERLAGGLRHVQEIADQVQVIGNRATLIALEAATRGTGAPGNGDPLQALARDAQAATARTAELAREVDHEVGAAIEAMRGLRERVAAALSAAPEPSGAPAARAAAPAARLIERLRDTVSDAATRGERLSAAGERASSAAERLMRRIEADARALEDLASGIEPPAREDGR